MLLMQNSTIRGQDKLQAGSDHPQEANGEFTDLQMHMQYPC